MQAIPGIRGAGRRGLHTADDRGGKEFQGETAGTGALPGMREGIGKGVTGGAPPNPARRGKRGDGGGEQQGRQWQRAQDFRDEVSHKIRTKTLPSLRV